LTNLIEFDIITLSDKEREVKRMDITYEINRDETHYTFYSLDTGDVFKLEENSGDSIFIKIDCHNAFDLIYNKLIPMTGGCNTHKLNTELIIHERAKGMGIY
jgi:hypothetical protein